MIRTLVFILLTSSVIAIGTAPARGESPPQHVAVADLGLHVIGAGVQRTVQRRVALEAVLEWYVPWTHEDALFDATGGVVRVRAFVHRGAAPTGLWLSPFTQLGVVSGQRAGTRRFGPAGALGLSAGYAWLVARRLHVVAGAGVQYEVGRIPGGDGQPSFASVHPAIDLVVGWAF